MGSIRDRTTQVFPLRGHALRVVLGLPSGIQPERFGLIVIERDLSALALSWDRWS